MSGLIYILIHTGVYSTVFILIHVGFTTTRAAPKWNTYDTVVVIWGLIYSLTALVYGGVGMKLAEWINLTKPESEYLMVVTLIGIPGFITALLVQRAWNSDQIGLAVLLGTAVAIVIGLKGSALLVIIAPFFWNLIYATSCALFGPDSESVSPKNECSFCGYSIEGLPDGVPCPECGTPQESYRPWLNEVD